MAKSGQRPPKAWLTALTAKRDRGGSILKLRALICLALIHTLVDCFSQFVSPLWPRFQSQLEIEAAVIPLLFAAWQTGASMSQPLFGYIGDRFDTRWIVALGPALAIACIASVGHASNALTLGLLLFMGGLGIGGFHPEAAVGVVQSSGKSITRGLAIFTFGGMVGLGLGPVLSGKLTDHFGMPSLIWAAVPGLVLLGILVFLRGPTTHPHAHSANGGASFAAMLDGRGWSVLLLLTVATLRVVPAVGVPFCLAFVLEKEGSSDFHIGLVQGIFLFAGGLGTLLCPLLSRAGRELGTLIGTTLVAACFLTLLTKPEKWMLYVGLAGSGFLLQGTIPILIAYSQRLLPRGQRLAASLTLGASWGLGGVIVAGLKLIFTGDQLPNMLWAMVPFALASSACAALLPRVATATSVTQPVLAASRS
jgi:FSR family fosmidomycin resistance protein-like MFS transporter